MVLVEAKTFYSISSCYNQDSVRKAFEGYPQIFLNVPDRVLCLDSCCIGCSTQPDLGLWGGGSHSDCQASLQIAALGSCSCLRLRQMQEVLRKVCQARKQQLAHSEACWKRAPTCLPCTGNGFTIGSRVVNSGNLVRQDLGSSTDLSYASLELGANTTAGRQSQVQIPPRSASAQLHVMKCEALYLSEQAATNFAPLMQQMGLIWSFCNTRTKQPQKSKICCNDLSTWKGNAPLRQLL